MSREQEQLLCDALVHLGPVETEQGLHAEGVRKIQEVIRGTGCGARATHASPLSLKDDPVETSLPGVFAGGDVRFGSVIYPFFVHLFLRE
jgi:hypothetical protein